MAWTKTNSLADYLEIELLRRTPFITTWLMAPKSHPTDRVIVKVGYLKLVYEASRDRLGESWGQQVLESCRFGPINYSKFHGHPNQLRLLDHFLENEETLVLVLEFCSGYSLAEAVMQRRNYLPETQIHHLALELALVVQSFHDKAASHGDIRPSNVFLTSSLDDASNCSLKLGGFSITKVMRESHYSLSHITHLAPEQFDVPTATFQSDMFSIGVVIYQLASLKLPFDGQTFLETLDAISNRTADPLPDCYSKDLQSLVSSLLSKNPNNRPTVNDLLKTEWLVGSMLITKSLNLHAEVRQLRQANAMLKDDFEKFKTKVDLIFDELSKRS